ncbi:hypothetical protein [Psychromonas arctica]|uniref:hypothetical protein n=1 Tax=Psychromonas arctica TaxID=168275 RepID=UPI002FD63D23
MELTTNNPEKNASTLEVFEEHLNKAIGKPTLDFRMQTVRGLRKNTTREIKIYNGAHKATWAKTIINRKLRTIYIDVFINFKKNDLNSSDYNRLKELAIEGIKQYWSNNITVDGVVFKVIVNCLHKDSSIAIPVDLKIEEGLNYNRPMNPAILGIDASFIYQRGQRKAGISSKIIDAEFKLTSAHEFGHSILMYAGGIGLSWGHKGSTHILLQSVKSSMPEYPKNGKIDIMKYYDDKSDPKSLFRRLKNSIAMEIDLKRLIWSSSILWKN